MGVNWVKARNRYINGTISQRKLADELGVSFRTVSDRSRNEGWVEQRKQQREKNTAKLLQKTADTLVDKEVSRMKRISDINDQLLDSIEKAMKELNVTIVKNKKQKKKSKYDGEGGKSEILEIEEIVDTASGIIDVQRVRQLTSALHDIAEISSMTNGYTKQENEETDIVKALREAYQEKDKENAVQ